MIELNYFLEEQIQTVYQVIQFRPGEPWRIVDSGELLGSIEKSEGLWKLRCQGSISETIVNKIGRLIDDQEFNLLPMSIKNRWKEEVLETIAQSDNTYLVVCRKGIDFERFEKIFRAYISQLVKDRWEISFNIYDSEMESDFQVLVN